MKTSTTRRTILAGLAAAPVAGLPAIAEVLPVADPVLAALAEYRHAAAVLDAAYARSKAICDKLDETYRAIGLVTYKGVTVYSTAALDFQKGHRSPRPTYSELEAAMMADIRKDWIEMGLVEADHEYEAARAILIEREPIFCAALAESGLREAEAAENEPFEARTEAECAVVEAIPTTRAGAVALLRFIADNFDDLIDDSRESAPDAIRAAVAMLEGEARS